MKILQKTKFRKSVVALPPTSNSPGRSVVAYAVQSAINSNRGFGLPASIAAARSMKHSTAERRGKHKHQEKRIRTQKKFNFILMKPTVDLSWIIRMKLSHAAPRSNCYCCCK
ncbi:hypothetical protein AVEN_3501-1 [Araneus ventricosus]|uniref:Uncharacterized protein n=1 Tax=Araneus ventricosus TaxID=182803 RepID=A0A4Y2JPX6_ARAVE|nr:hypothetical protein AVEN_3501-1 [Araneus ventricosus]